MEHHISQLVDVRLPARGLRHLDDAEKASRVSHGVTNRRLLHGGTARPQLHLRPQLDRRGVAARDGWGLPLERDRSHQVRSAVRPPQRSDRLLSGFPAHVAPANARGAPAQARAAHDAGPVTDTRAG